MKHLTRELCVYISIIFFPIALLFSMYAYVFGSSISIYLSIASFIVSISGWVFRFVHEHIEARHSAHEESEPQLQITRTAHVKRDIPEEISQEKTTLDTETHAHAGEGASAHGERMPSDEMQKGTLTTPTEYDVQEDVADRCNAHETPSVSTAEVHTPIVPQDTAPSCGTKEQSENTKVPEDATVEVLPIEPLKEIDFMDALDDEDEMGDDEHPYHIFDDARDIPYEDKEDAQDTMQDNESPFDFDVEQFERVLTNSFDPIGMLRTFIINVEKRSLVFSDEDLSLHSQAFEKHAKHVRSNIPDKQQVQDLIQGYLFEADEPYPTNNDPIPSSVEVILARQLTEAGIFDHASDFPEMKAVVLPTSRLIYLKIFSPHVSRKTMTKIEKIEAALNAAVMLHQQYPKLEIMAPSAFYEMHYLYTRFVNALSENISEPLLNPRYDTEEAGEWNVRQAISYTIEASRLPYRLQADFRVNVGAGNVAIEFVATHEDVFPYYRSTNIDYTPLDISVPQATQTDTILSADALTHDEQTLYHLKRLDILMTALEVKGKSWHTPTSSTLTNTNDAATEKLAQKFATQVKHTDTDDASEETMSLVATDKTWRRACASEYTLRCALFLAAMAFRSSSAINHVWVNARSAHTQQKRYLLSVDFDRVRMERVDMQDTSDLEAIYHQFVPQMRLEDGILRPVEPLFSLDDPRFCPPQRYRYIAHNTTKFTRAAQKVFGTTFASGLAITNRDRLHQAALELAHTLARGATDTARVLGVITNADSKGDKLHARSTTEGAQTRKHNHQAYANAHTPAQPQSLTHTKTTASTAIQPLSYEHCVHTLFRCAKKIDDPLVDKAARRCATKLIRKEIDCTPPSIIDEFLHGDEMDVLCRRAVEACNKHHFSHAIHLLKPVLDALDEDKTYADTKELNWRYFGSYVDRALFNVRYPDLAIEREERAQYMHEDDIPIYLTHAHTPYLVAEFRWKQHKTSVMLIPDAIYEARFCLSVALCSKGRMQEGLAQAVKLVSMAPCDTRARMQLINCLLQTKDHARAAQEIKELLKLGHQREALAFCYYNMAHLMSLENNNLAAKACYDLAIHFMPELQEMEGTTAHIHLPEGQTIPVVIHQQTEQNDRIATEDIESILEAHNIPVAPTQETVSFLLEGTKEALNAELFGVARNFAKQLFGLTHDDVFIGIIRSIEASPQERQAAEVRDAAKFLENLLESLGGKFVSIEDISEDTSGEASSSTTGFFLGADDEEENEDDDDSDDEGDDSDEDNADNDE